MIITCRYRFARLTFLVTSLLFPFIFSSCSKDEGLPLLPVGDVSVSTTLPNNNVRSIIEDNDGYMWISTDMGINLYNGRIFKQRNSPSDSLALPSSIVWDAMEDSSNRLWVASQDGLYYVSGSFAWTKAHTKPSPVVFTHIRMNSRGEVFASTSRALYKYDSEENVIAQVCTFESYESSSTNNVFIDPKDNIWQVQANSLTKYSGETYKSLKSYGVSSDIVSSALIDDVLWLVSENGVCLFDTSSEAFVPLPSCLSSDQDFMRSEWKTMCKLKNGAAFVSMSDIIYFYNSDIGTLRKETNYQSNSVSCVYIDSKDNCWIGFENNGFALLDSSHSLSSGETSICVRTSGMPVKCLDVDSDGNLWALAAKNFLFRLDSETDEVVRFDASQAINSQEKYSFKVDCFIFDKKDIGTLWLLSNSTLYKCRINGEALQLIREYNPSSSSQLNGLYQDKDGCVFAYGYGHYIYCLENGSSEMKSLFVSSIALSGMTDIVEIDDHTILFCAPFSPLGTYDLNTGQSAGIITAPGYFSPTDMMLSADGNVYITAVGYDLMRFKPGTDKSLESVGFLGSKYNNSILEDGDNIWIGSMRGLYRFNKQTRNYSAFYAGSNSDSKQFTNHTALLMSNGHLAFGAADGLVIINPSSLDSAHDNVKVYFTVLDTNKDSYLPQGPEVKDNYMNLSPGENDLTIGFNAVVYSSPDDITYKYLMKGYDHDWVNAGTSTQAVFTNLPAGDHTFLVQAYDSMGNPVGDELSLRIHIKRTFFSSVFMKFVYILLAAGLLYFIWRMLWNLQRKREEAEMERKEKERQLQMNEKTVDFFTSISHEFRTPLTMISGAATMLANENGVKPYDDRYTRILLRNADKMNRLVDQLLDMNKLENNFLKLSVSQSDIVEKIAAVVETFRLTAESKGLSLELELKQMAIEGWFDQDVIEKALYNLLSNAVKYTPSGGKIKVVVDVSTYEKAAEKLFLTKEDRYLLVNVVDNGIGIPEDQQDVIFNKFYQVKREHKIVGTGIGLYFTKQLLRLHHGDIAVSDPVSDNGDKLPGTEFSFAVPCSESSYSADEKASSSKPVAAENSAPHTDSEVNDDIVDTEDSSYPVVLAIDDDPEVLYYLKSILSSKYKVVVKFDATSGYGCIPEVKPDIIICDVLMMDMNGFEVCSMIKNNPDYSAIPVILLTAKTSNEDKLKGLEVKADAYVTKPFDPMYLTALVGNLLQQKKASQSVVSETTISTKDRLENALKEQDRKFMEDLYQCMEEELANEELNVPLVYEKLCMGRTKFYNKVKDLTGASPASLFRKYKLNRAKEILETGKYKISAVAQMTGFGSASYFSTLFKKQFGVTPKDYLVEKSNS